MACLSALSGSATHLTPPPKLEHSVRKWLQLEGKNKKSRKAQMCAGDDLDFLSSPCRHARRTPNRARDGPGRRNLMGGRDGRPLCPATRETLLRIAVGDEESKEAHLNRIVPARKALPRLPK